MVVENYPQLKANENFTRLMDELAGAENRLSVERMRYNEAIKVYNIRIQPFRLPLLHRGWGLPKGSLRLKNKLKRLRRLIFSSC